MCQTEQERKTKTIFYYNDVISMCKIIIIYFYRFYFREPSNSVHLWRRVRESNPGHIGGRRVFSPLRQPCSPGVEMAVYGLWRISLLTVYVYASLNYISFSLQRCSCGDCGAFNCDCLQRWRRCTQLCAWRPVSSKFYIDHVIIKVTKISKITLPTLP